MPEISRDPRTRTHPFLIRDEFSLPEGPASLVLPDRLSPESLAEVIEWFRLVERKLTRWSNPTAEVIRTAEESTNV